MQFWKRDKSPTTEHVEPGMSGAPSGTNPIKFSEEPMFGTSSIPLSAAEIPGRRDTQPGEFVTYPNAFPQSRGVHPGTVSGSSAHGATGVSSSGANGTTGGAGATFSANVLPNGEINLQTPTPSPMASAGASGMPNGATHGVPAQAMSGYPQGANAYPGPGAQAQGANGYPAASGQAQAANGYPAASGQAQAANGYPAASGRAQAANGYSAATAAIAPNTTTAPTGATAAGVEAAASQAGESSSEAVKPAKKGFFSRKPKPVRDPSELEEEAFLKKQKWIRARRRFIGVLVLLVTAGIACSLLFDKEPPPPSVTIPLRIPKESSVDVAKVTIPTAPNAAQVVDDKAGGKGAGSTKASGAAQGATPSATAKAPGSKSSAADQASKGSTGAAGATAGAANTAAAAKKDAPSQAGSVKADTAKPGSTQGAGAKGEAQKTDVKKEEAKKAQAQKDNAKDAKKAEEKPKALPKGQYYIQVIALSNQKKAQDIVSKMKSAGVNAFLSPVNTKNGKVWRVQAGPYKTKTEANSASAKLALAGLSPGQVLQVK